MKAQYIVSATFRIHESESLPWPAMSMGASVGRGVEDGAAMAAGEVELQTWWDSGVLVEALYSVAPAGTGRPLDTPLGTAWTLQLGWGLYGRDPRRSARH